MRLPKALASIALAEAYAPQPEAQQFYSVGQEANGQDLHAAAMRTNPTSVRPRSVRIRHALLIGLAAGLATSLALRGQEGAADFHPAYRAGIALWRGLNPYDVVVPIANRFPFDEFFRYPLPAGMVAMLVAWLPPKLAAGAFVGASFALAAYGLSGLGHWRMAVLASAPAFFVFDVAQWMPLLLGAALLPEWGFLLACKPHVAAALFLWRPSWRAFWGGVALCALGLLLVPSWPLDWVHVNLTYPLPGYGPPITKPYGLFVLLAALRWRRPEARLILLLSCLPQNLMFYDQLPLMLVPSTQWGSLAFALWSHVVRGIAIWTAPQHSAEWMNAWTVRAAWVEPFVMVGLYWPAVAMILRRPNEGPIPAWLEARVGAVPARLRGRSVPTNA